MQPADERRLPAMAAVTGLGAVTASGTTVAALFDDVRWGRRPFTEAPVAPVANALPLPEGHDPTVVSPLRAGHVHDPLPLADVLGARMDRALSRDSRLLIHAAHQARTAAGGDTADPERTGVVLGTLGAGRSEYLAIHDAAGGRSRKVNPVWGPHSGYNAAAAQVSIALSAQGPNITLCAGATAGLDAIATGAGYVRDGVCDTVVAAGLDTLCAVADADPWHADSDPVPPGEAAAALILQPVRTAGGQALAHVWGTAQATAVTTDTATGEELGWAAADAARTVLRHAGRDATQVGLIVVAGTGDAPCDQAVREALEQLSGDAARICDVTGTTGRTGGADGTLSAAVAVEALRRGTLPTAQAVPAGDLALCVAVDPAGQATALLLGRAGAVGEDPKDQSRHGRQEERQ